MRAVVMEEFGAPPVVRDVPEPVAPPGGAVIEVDATGVCRSDWHTWQGHDTAVTLPHVAGHELAGRVVALGDGRARLGARRARHRAVRLRLRHVPPVRPR